MSRSERRQPEDSGQAEPVSSQGHRLRNQGRRLQGLSRVSVGSLYARLLHRADCLRFKTRNGHGLGYECEYYFEPCAPLAHAPRLRPPRLRPPPLRASRARAPCVCLCIDAWRWL